MTLRVTCDSPTPLMIAAEENLHEHISLLQRTTPGMKVLDHEDLLLVDSGVASDTFNKVARTRIKDADADGRIEEVIAHFRLADRPFGWWVGPASKPVDLEERLLRHGLATGGQEPGMALELRDLAARPSVPEGLKIQRVATTKELTESCEVFAANWEPPDPAVMEFFTRCSAALLKADSPMRIFVAYLDGQPAATSEVLLGGRVAGLYGVATKRKFRGRGIGSAISWAAADHARRHGIATMVLQASEAGRRVYSRLGFREFCRFAEYTLLQSGSD